MLPLAFLAVAGGALLLVAGVTGSSLGSVLKGHPDHAHAAALSFGGPAASPQAAAGVVGASGSSSGLLGAAQTQIGVPYRWGGEIEKIAFDCSGLVQWAAKKAGISLPRTAQEQYDATQRVGPGEVVPGDLVFFGSSSSGVSHVGIVAGPGLMLDAPHTGSTVRYESFPEQLGASWGSDKVIGYGKP